VPKAAVQRNAEAGRRTGGGSRPFGYKIIYHDLGEGSKRQRRIIGEELEKAEADAVREAVSRVLRGESLRSIAFDFNQRGIKPAGGKKNGESKIDKWQGPTLRRVLISPRIAGLREHNGEVVGKAVWPAAGGWSATSSRGRVEAMGTGKTRTQTARPECESSLSLWRLTSRAT